MFQPSIAHGQQLRHPRGQSDFFACPRGEEPLGNNGALRVGARGHEGPHVSHGAHRRAASPPRPPAPQGPTVAREGRHADAGRALLSRACPPRGEFQPQRAGPHGPHARGTRPPLVVFPPQGAGPEPRLEGGVQRGDARMEPRPRGGHSLREALARPRQAVLRRSPPDDPWLAAPKEGAQLWRLSVGPRARRRADHGGTRRPRACLQRIGRGPWPGGARDIPGVPRGDTNDRQARRRQGGRSGTLQAPGGFQHSQGRVEGLQPVHERHAATGIVGDRPALPGGASGHIPLGFRHINTPKAWHGPPTPSCPPALAETGSMAPNHGTGSGSPGRDDPRSAPVSLDQGSIGLSRPGSA